MNPDTPAYPATIDELTIDVAGYTLAALKSATSVTSSNKILCVHGWLDNAASFVPLMSCDNSVRNADIVAIDLPGHGYSTTLDAAGYPNFLELGLLLPRVVTALGWQQCHLVGHSLGANLALAAAVAAPQLFSSLVMLESAGPPVEPAEKLPGRLQKALQDRVDNQRFKSRQFEDPQAAVSTRLAAARMSVPAAEMIIERQLKTHNGTFSWRFDPRFRYASPFYLTEEHVKSLLQSVQQQTLVILADDGIFSGDEHPAKTLDKRLNNIPSASVHSIPGNHHMHMDTPDKVAELLNEHLQEI